MIKYQDFWGNAISSEQWASEFGQAEKRRVAHTTVWNGLWVSTVLLGFDHSGELDGSEMFETMVFPPVGHCGGIVEWRTPTWAKAAEAHGRAVFLASVLPTIYLSAMRGMVSAAQSGAWCKARWGFGIEYPRWLVSLGWFWDGIKRAVGAKK